MTPMMRLTQPRQIRARLDPSTNLIRLGDPRIVRLKPLQIHAVLQRELHMRVMQLQRPIQAALRKVAPVHTNRTLRRRVGAPVKLVEVAVVRVALPSGVGWVSYIV